MDDFVDFGQKKGKFTDYFEKALTSKVFWNLILPESENLATLALKLTSIPASNSQIERIFHSWSTIHTSARSRLTSERSKKLAHVYYSLSNRVQKPEKPDDHENQRQAVEEIVEEIPSDDDDDVESVNFNLDDISDVSDEEIEELLELVNQNQV